MFSLILQRIRAGARGRGALCWLLLLLMLVLGSGCSSEQFKRLAYQLSTAYSCVQSNNHRPNEGVRDLQCSDPTTNKRMSYEEYKKQRDNILKQQK